MKRYRVLAFDFDSRATALKIYQSKGSSSGKAQKQKKANVSRIREGLIAQYGVQEYERKIRDFIDLGPNPVSLISFHNKFLRQCRNAFVFGSYYPSLVSACTLGERILNRLVLHLRDYYKNSPEYKKIYKQNSFDKWMLAINTLVSWNVLLPKPTDNFKKLEKLRHQSIHFNPEANTDARNLALEAIQLLQSIVEEQFSAFGTQPWYIKGIKGSTYIAKDYEQHPFVQEVIIPNCRLVGPDHRLEYSQKGWVVHDEEDYPEREITDEEFAELIK